MNIRKCEICGADCALRGDWKKLEPGRQIYKKYCSTCNNSVNELGKEAIPILKRKAQLEPCSNCGFNPKHKCQMDIDHIDGNKHNGDPSNLQILCSNCHRLKTHKCQDHML